MVITNNDFVNLVFTHTKKQIKETKKHIEMKIKRTVSFCERSQAASAVGILTAEVAYGDGDSGDSDNSTTGKGSKDGDEDEEEE